MYSVGAVEPEEEGDGDALGLGDADPDGLGDDEVFGELDGEGDDDESSSRAPIACVPDLLADADGDGEDEAVDFAAGLLDVLVDGDGLEPGLEDGEGVGVVGMVVGSADGRPAFARGPPFIVSHCGPG
jgi:hypothetical protein